MKRSGPLKRSSGLKRANLSVDPEKTQAWLERTRAAAVERERRRREEMPPGGPPAAQRRRATSDEPNPESVRAKRSALRKVTVRYKRPAESAGWCARCSKYKVRPWKAQEWHHLLPQRVIREYVDGRVRELSAKQLAKLLRRLLADERNLIALCGSCHERHEKASARLVAEDVPSVAHEFAAELGPEWAERLLRMYPSRQGVPASTVRGGSS